MKRILLVLAVATVISSCTKTWTCEITTTSTLGTSVHYYDFKGTKSEMKEFEASGNQEVMGIVQVTECK